jgi:hypothetical protein|tara:strand:+ start:28948 stop:29205 length:258 start_codon:yes stop_codon:yes gene_type:complete
MPFPGGLVDEGVGDGLGDVDDGFGVGVGEEDTDDLIDELDGLGVGIGDAEELGAAEDGCGGSFKASTQYDFPAVKPAQLGPMVGF